MICLIIDRVYNLVAQYIQIQAFPIIAILKIDLEALILLLYLHLGIEVVYYYNQRQLQNLRQYHTNAVYQFCKKVL
jgi:hypothetical protein